MQTYYVTIKTGPGSTARVSVQASDIYAARKHFDALYGDKVLTSPTTS